MSARHLLSLIALVVAASTGVARVARADDGARADDEPETPELAPDADALPLEEAPAAELSPVRLVSWSAPAKCPSQAALLAALRDELSAAPPTGLVELSVAVAIVERDGEFVLKLGLERGGSLSVRELRDRNCEAVVLAAALTLAMAVETAEQVSDKPVEVDAPPPPNPDVPPPPVLYRRGSRSLLPTIRLGYATEVGLLPGWGSGIEVGAAVHVQRFRFEVGTTYWFERESADDGVGIRVSLLSGLLRGCARPVRRLRLSGCIGLEVGSFRGRGTGIAQTSEGAVVGVASSAGVSGSISLVGRWSLRAYADASVQVRRPDFVILPNRQSLGPELVTSRFVVFSELEF